MQFIIARDYDDLSRKAADIIAAELQRDLHCRLGLATGSTPIGLYAELVHDVEEGLISFAHALSFNLDEYRGVEPDHPQSYRYFMNKHLFDLVDIDHARTFVPEGSNPDERIVCAAYEEEISQAGGIDIQLLGIGHNGHIGFNEPSDSFPVSTHLVNLAKRTIEANSRLFDSIDDVPRQAYTMGIGTIMKAKRVLLVASGEDKAEIVYKSFFGPVIPQVPASALQLHPHVTVLLDEAAGSMIASRLTYDQSFAEEIAAEIAQHETVAPIYSAQNLSSHTSVSSPHTEEAL